MKRVTLALAFLTLVSAACDRYDAASSDGDFVGRPGQGIVGGVPVANDDPISARTALVIAMHRQAICTASILNNKWLLTAAHCVVETQADSLIVAFSGTLSDFFLGLNQKDLRPVAEIQIHPSYTQTANTLDELNKKAKAEGRELTVAEIDAVTDWGDIALLRIEGAVPSSKQAVTFLPSSSQLVKNQTVVLAGFGRTKVDRGAPAGELHKVSVQIAEPLWGKSEVLMDNSKKGACHGDSGGPAYVVRDGQYYLFGVTSRTVADGGKCDKFSAYTSTAFYRSWIKSITGI